MEDISITLVKNNKYYIKTPFKCEVIKLLVENNEDLSENQSIAILKADNFIFELESEYPGIINNIIVDEGDVLNRWDVLMSVDVKKNYGEVNVEVNSTDYKLIYDFQHDILPNYFYNNKKSFADNVDEYLVFNLIKEIFDKNNMIVPFRMDELNVEIDDADGNIMIRVDFPDFKALLLVNRFYFMINEEKGNYKCFTCEKNLDGELMIFSVNDDEGHLTRFNYGNAPESIDLEKQRIIEIFQ